MLAINDPETKLKYEPPQMDEELAGTITIACLWYLSLARHSVSAADRQELLELSPYINELLMDGQLLQRYFHRMLDEIVGGMNEEAGAVLRDRFADDLALPPSFPKERRGDGAEANTGSALIKFPHQILAKLNSKLTKEIFSILPDELQTAVVLRIADVEQVTPEMLQELDDVIQRDIGSIRGIQRCKVCNIEKVVGMLNHLDRSKKTQILGKLDVLSPHLAAVMRKRLFRFEDIFALDDSSVQTILREISNDSLTIAIKNSSNDVKDKIFRNISSLAADMIKEDLEVMGPVRLSDVEMAQSTIVKLVRNMEETGRICFSERGSDDPLV